LFEGEGFLFVGETEVIHKTPGLEFVCVGGFAFVVVFQTGGNVVCDACIEFTRRVYTLDNVDVFHIDPLNLYFVAKTNTLYFKSDALNQQEHPPRFRFGG